MVQQKCKSSDILITESIDTDKHFLLYTIYCYEMIIKKKNVYIHEITLILSIREGAKNIAETIKRQINHADVVLL